MKTLTLFSAGLAQGQKLAQHARTMAAYSNEEVSIETVTDLSAMTQAGVHKLPAVAVDGKVVCEGRVPTVDELRAWVNDTPEIAA
jgi:hypothetical protein